MASMSCLLISHNKSTGEDNGINELSFLSHTTKAQGKTMASMSCLLISHYKSTGEGNGINELSSYLSQQKHRGRQWHQWVVFLSLTTKAQGKIMTSMSCLLISHNKSTGEDNGINELSSYLSQQKHRGRQWHQWVVFLSLTTKAQGKTMASMSCLLISHNKSTGEDNDINELSSYLSQQKHRGRQWHQWVVFLSLTTKAQGKTMASMSCLLISHNKSTGEDNGINELSSYLSQQKHRGRQWHQWVVFLSLTTKAQGKTMASMSCLLISHNKSTGEDNGINELSSYLSQQKHRGRQWHQWVVFLSLTTKAQGKTMASMSCLLISHNKSTGEDNGINELSSYLSQQKHRRRQWHQWVVFCVVKFKGNCRVLASDQWLE